MTDQQFEVLVTKLDEILWLIKQHILRAEPRVEEPITPSDLPPPRDVYNPQDKL